MNVPTNRIPVPRLVRALHWLSLAALGSTLALPGCQSASEGTPAPGQVSGQLVDVIHDRPAAGVHVRAHDMGETITDADGRFQLTLPSGTHTLYLSGEGVLSGQVERVEVRASKPLTLRAEVFPRDPSDEAINAYFERRGPRGREHPAYRSPDDPDPTVDHDHMDGDVDDHVGGAVQALVEVPAVIRVWRSSQSGALAPTLNNGWADNSCNSAVTVETLPLEEYVRGVVPREWLSSWHDESLRAGAIAARTFAVRWALRGGRWDCADVDDGTVTQVYSSLRTDRANAAVAATEGLVVTRDGAVISTEFSAENSDPTATGVSDPTCTGTTLFGHGRGMCQWGTQRWATGVCANPPCDFGAFGAEPKDHLWMVEHYFPNSDVEEAYSEPVTPCALIPAAGGIVDEEGPCFQAFGNPTYWREETAGHDGHLFWTNAFTADAPANWASWRLHFTEAGDYEVEVYVDATFGVYPVTRYIVEHAGGEDEVVVDQGVADGWVSLGVFAFDDEGRVRVLDNVDGAVAANQHIVADAVQLTRIAVPPTDGRRDAGHGRRNRRRGRRHGRGAWAPPTVGLRLSHRQRCREPRSAATAQRMARGVAAASSSPRTRLASRSLTAPNKVGIRPCPARLSVPSGRGQGGPCPGWAKERAWPTSKRI
ncbi:MAG: carboxypeptidase regulatory-like domain-containing protein [Sandaracinaceae bacterium]|nr:carboxypeptidase regulatory-like domain-containing protein [Sandaracinaceae bacterium]